MYSAGKYASDIAGLGNIEYVKIFSLIAFIILFIACINFMNLSTARATKRAKEVGMRKVVGAGRSQIIKQFYLESIFYSIFDKSSATKHRSFQHKKPLPKRYVIPEKYKKSAK